MVRSVLQEVQYKHKLALKSWNAPCIHGPTILAVYMGQDIQE